MYRIKALLYKCQEFGWDGIIKFLFDLYDDYSGINVPLVAVCNVPPVAQCNVPPQKWLQ